MLLTGWCRLRYVHAGGDWMGEVVGIVGRCGVGVVVVGEDGGEWGSDMGPRQGGQHLRRDTGPTTWASGGRTRILEYCSYGLETVHGGSVCM